MWTANSWSTEINMVKKLKCSLGKVSMTRRQTILRIRRQQDHDWHRWAGSRIQSPGEVVWQTSSSRLQSRLIIPSWQVPIGLGRKAELEAQVCVWTG